MRSLSSHASIIGSCIFSVWLLSLITVRAQEYLTFAPKVHAVNVQFEVLSYKEIRSREICTMAKEAGFSEKDCTLIIAHAMTECGSMDEFCGWTEGSYRSDAGLAIGLFQFHLCYRYSEWMKQNKFGCPHGNPRKAGKIRDKFFQDFPEMKTWRGQVEKYLGEMKVCTEKKNLKQCIDRWNAHPDYMTRVYGKMSLARSLLSL